MGCRSAGPAVAPVAAAASTAALVGRVDPWRLSAEELQSQRIFRLQYDGPDGGGSLNLTLRLESESRYQMTAVDRVLKRRVWGLEVAGERALVLDHRQRTYCWYGGEVEISVVPLGPLPFRTLPALLLGRLPLAPAGEVAVDRGGELRFEDARGREWRVRLQAGRPLRWTLYSAAEPKVWWQRDGDGQRLSARDEGLQLRWIERVSEPLREALDPPAPPSGYLPDCVEGTGV